MGAWGPGIYQDDIALDIKGEYIDLLHKGKTKEEAFQELVDNSQDYLQDEEDCIPAVLALADTQWKYGKLIPAVKEDALKIINEGYGLIAWQDDQKDYKKRKEILDKLKEKLESPQPPEKQIKPVRLYKCEWKLGDAYAYQFESEEAKEQGLYGKYIILIKVDEYTWAPGHIIPIVWVKITNDSNLPTNEAELEKLKYIQTSFNNYKSLFDSRFGMKEDKRKKLENLEYKVNQYYQLPIYRIKMLSTSKRIIPKKLIYLGNYPNLTPPAIEYKDLDKISLYSISWKELESRVIEFYNLFYKKELFDDECIKEKIIANQKFLEEKGFDFKNMQI